MAAIISRTGGYSNALGASSGFNDVNSTCFAENDINNVCEKGILSGYLDNTFRPYDNTLYSEFITAVVRLIEVQNGNDCSSLIYPYDYIEKAEYFNLSRDISTDDIFAHITRRDAAVIINNALYVALKDGSTLLSKVTNNTQTPESSIRESSATINSKNKSAFAYNMNSQMDKNKNYMFSPLSIKTALAMTANGAKGETKSEILKTLGINDLDEFNQEINDTIKSKRVGKKIYPALFMCKNIKNTNSKKCVAKPLK